MEELLTVLSSVGLSGVFVLLLLFIAKNYLAEKISGAIRLEYDKKLEEYKESLHAELQLKVSRDEYLFVKYQEKLAETVSETYRLLRALDDSLRRYTTIMEGPEDEAKVDRRERLNKAFQEFHAFYASRQIYLPKQTAADVNKIVSEVFGAGDEFALMVEGRERQPDTHRTWIAVVKRVQEVIQPLLSRLEDDFRLLLSEGANKTRK